MAKGLDTMIQENPKEEITESSGLQIGTANTIIGSPVVKSEFADLSDKNAQVSSMMFNLTHIRRHTRMHLHTRTKKKNRQMNEGPLMATGHTCDTPS